MESHFRSFFPCKFQKFSCEPAVPELFVQEQGYIGDRRIIPSDFRAKTPAKIPAGRVITKKPWFPWAVSASISSKVWEGSVWAEKRRYRATSGSEVSE